MPVTRTRRDAAFWEIVGDLHWKLDEDGGDPPEPPDEPAFDRGGGGGVWPSWSTHLVAFLLGGLTWGALLIAPPALPVVALGGVICFMVIAVKHRWR